jgi:hypothetical protein
MDLNPVVIAADASAILLASSKTLTALQPIWAKLPKWLAVALPVIVAVVPQIAGQLGGVVTTTDLVNVTITAIALLVPGIASAETPAQAAGRKLLEAKLAAEKASDF